MTRDHLEKIAAYKPAMDTYIEVDRRMVPMDAPALARALLAVLDIKPFKLYEGEFQCSHCKGYNQALDDVRKTVEGEDT